MPLERIYADKGVKAYLASARTQVAKGIAAYAEGEAPIEASRRRGAGASPADWLRRDTSLRSAVAKPPHGKRDSRSEMERASPTRLHHHDAGCIGRESVAVEIDAGCIEHETEPSHHR